MDRSKTHKRLNELGISLQTIQQRNLQLFEEANLLNLAEIDDHGREHFLIEEAANVWRDMKMTAKQDGESIFIVSAFRSISRQCEIIRSNVQRGQSIDDILKVCAPPGFSEHHTGCAVDISTDGVDMLSEEFESTTAFQWLYHNASKFSFYLSYPRNNKAGYYYEPWHWKYNAS